MKLILDQFLSNQTIVVKLGFTSFMCSKDNINEEFLANEQKTNEHSYRSLATPLVPIPFMLAIIFIPIIIIFTIIY